MEATPQVTPLTGPAEAPGLFDGPRPEAGGRDGADRVVFTDARVLFDALSAVSVYSLCNDCSVMYQPISARS